jgi:coenzyme PQQ biosynthesis protein PqqD
VFLREKCRCSRERFSHDNAPADVTTHHYRLARGMRLHRDADGSASLLVPEGIVALNETAAAALALADGTRGDDDIAAILAERFDDPEGTIANDVRALLDDLAECGFLTR